MIQVARKAHDWCAIDFGTSNSAVAVPDRTSVVELVPLEGRAVTMPTAVFYRADDDAAHLPRCEFGRAAISAYVDGLDGRLMRSMKSILGSTLLEQRTEVGAGRSVRYADVVAGYLRHLKDRAEAHAGRPLMRAVVGRPVHFVDDDAVRDAQAQAALAGAARSVGFEEIAFQFEPIAAALDYEARLDREQLVLVADIGGGTSDFSLVRLGPALRRQSRRDGDILANHGVHAAGTDFDRRLSLATTMRCLGLGAHGPSKAGAPPREVPSAMYFTLATWHLIPTAYAPSRVAEMRRLRGWYADAAQHRRLMTVLEGRLGHALAARAEQAKIEAATRGRSSIDLADVEASLALTVSEGEVAEAIESDCLRIESAAAETVRRASLSPDAVDAVYLTGGSTGLQALARRIVGRFPRARAVQGDHFASVARGLGETARRHFGTSSN